MWSRLIPSIPCVTRTCLVRNQKSFCSIVIANIFLIILASFSDSLDSLKIRRSGHLLFSAIHKWPFHRISEILLRLPLLPVSAGFCFVGTEYHFIYSFSDILVTLFAKNCFWSLCLFNQCKTTVLLSTHWLILHCNVSMKLLHFLLNLRPCVLRQVTI